MAVEAESFYLAALEKLALKEVKRLGFEYQAQKLMHRFKVDFMFFSEDGRKLVVEIDGPEHNSKNQRQIDHDRDATAARWDFAVLRLKNDEVFDKISKCMLWTITELKRLRPRAREEIEKLDQTYRQFLVEEGRYRTDAPHLSKISVLDPDGRQYEWAIWDVYKEFEKAAGVDFFKRDRHHKAYLQLHDRLRTDSKVFTKTEMRELHKEIYNELRNRARKNIAEGRKENRKQELKQKEREASLARRIKALPDAI